MTTDTPPSAATNFALAQRQLMPRAIWSIFTVLEDDKTITIQGATMYGAGGAVLPFALRKIKAKI